MAAYPSNLRMNNSKIVALIMPIMAIAFAYSIHEHDQNLVTKQLQHSLQDGLDAYNHNSDRNAERFWREGLKYSCKSVQDQLLSAGIETWLGTLLKERGQYKESCSFFSSALCKYKALLGERNLITATSMYDLASALYLNGSYERSQDLASRSLAIRTAIRGTNTIEAARSQNLLGKNLVARHQFSDAERRYLKAISICSISNADKTEILPLRGNLAALYKMEGRFKEAETLAKSILVDTETLQGFNSPETATCENNLATIFEDEGKFDEAEKLYKHAIELRTKLLGREHPNTVISCCNLAHLYKNKGEFEKAEAVYLDARKAMELQLGVRHPATQNLLNSMAHLYKQQGKLAKASEVSSLLE